VTIAPLNELSIVNQRLLSSGKTVSSRWKFCTAILGDSDKKQLSKKIPNGGKKASTPSQ
jgi:hypothetical protein